MKDYKLISKRKTTFSVSITPEDLAKIDEDRGKETRSRYIINNLTIINNKLTINNNNSQPKTNGIFKGSFQELLKILKEFSQGPYLTYTEGSEKLFNPEMQQYWVDIVTRHNISLIDNAEEYLKNE